ncbi:hypothetical protein QYF61_021067, partial [Mycteria americana]
MPIRAMSSQFLQENAVGNDVKGFTKGQVIKSQTKLPVASRSGPSGWKRPLRSSSPTVNLALPSPPLNMSLSTTSTRLLNTSRDGNSTTSLGSLFQCLTTLSVNKFFLISNLNPPWCNLRPFPLVLSLVTWEKRPTPTWLQPPYRQLKRAGRFPLSLLFSRLNNPRSSYDLCSRPFTSFDIETVRGPKLSSGFEVQPHQCQAQGDDHFPSPASHTISDTSQDAIGLLGYLSTLLAHIHMI